MVPLIFCLQPNARRRGVKFMVDTCVNALIEAQSASNLDIAFKITNIM